LGVAVTGGLPPVLMASITAGVSNSRMPSEFGSKESEDKERHQKVAIIGGGTAARSLLVVNAPNVLH